MVVASQSKNRLRLRNEKGSYWNRGVDVAELAFDDYDIFPFPIIMRTNV
jgi:hypothetical protein